MVTLVFALAGSLFGLVLKTLTGAGSDADMPLIASCVVFSAAVLVGLIRRRGSEAPWLVTLVTSYFLAYLIAGECISAMHPNLSSGFLVYLLWFFVVFSFNRFVNTSKQNALLSKLIFISPIVLVAGRIATSPGLPVPDKSILIVFALCYTSFTLVLGLFSQHREAFLGERARLQALEDTAKVVRRSEARFRSLVQNSSDVILIASEDGLLSYQSPAAETGWGYAHNELVGQALNGFIHPDDLPGFNRIWKDVLLAPQATGSAELRVKTQGGWRSAVLILTNLLHEPGLGGLVVTAHDVTERMAFEEQLTHQAFYDSLTSLPNRLLFRDRLDQALLRSRHQDGLVGVLFLDLDNFKQINDSLGHGAGDELLRLAALRLRTCAGEDNTVARLGGDEFVILLDRVSDEPAAVALAARIVDDFAAPFPLMEREFVVSISIGIVVRPQQADGAEGLLRDADIAMYQAKNAGKARYVIFDPAMQAGALSRLELENDLRNAISRGELSVHYQPIVDLADARVSEVEALARWHHPTRGLISPAEFIPVAEQTGIIVPLGRWVLEQACRQAANWQALYPAATPLKISVNLSPRQFQSATLVEDVRHVLAQSGLAWNTLRLEITETAIMHDVEGTISTLSHLKALGVQLAVDDFGTGYSSLAYLKRLPLDVLKIDRSFVKGIEMEPEDRAIVKTILSLAKSLGLSVIAEGIETEGQALLLREWDCECGQGYIFSRPVTAADFTALLQASPRLSSRVKVA